jgi:hypothetical protein
MKICCVNVQELLPDPTTTLRVKFLKAKVSHSTAEELHCLANFSS